MIASPIKNKYSRIDALFTRPMYFRNDYEEIKVRTEPVFVENPDENTFKAFAKIERGEHRLMSNSKLVIDTLLMGQGVVITRKEYEAN